MHTINSPTKSQRMKVGGPLRVLLVVNPPGLLEHMAKVVRSMPDLRLVGSFGSVAETIDWLVWDREGWHLAFIDLGLREGGNEGGSEELIRRLVSQPRAGTVVAVGDHLWREVRTKCAAMGVHDLLEKGDLIAFQSYLEAKVL